MDVNGGGCMKNALIGCLVLFTMAAPTFAQTKVRLKQVLVDLGGGVRLKMVLIPAGEFKMGDDSGYEMEKPVHRVTISKPFFLGKHLVTQQQWQAVMENKPDSNGSTIPAAAAWDDCQTFIAKLNAKIGTQGGRFALPTEAQWEYACRAGSNTRYSFGDDEVALGNYAWYNANAGGQPHRVGEKKPNTWGLYDMHGNVWQWCADWYDPGYYAKSPLDDPRGPATGSDRVIRGGGLGPRRLGLPCRLSGLWPAKPREQPGIPHRPSSDRVGQPGAGSSFGHIFRPKHVPVPLVSEEDNSRERLRFD